MRNYILFFVYLISIFLAIPKLYAKGDSSVQTGDVLYLVTPQTAPGYVAVIFVDANTLAVLGDDTSGLGNDLFPCSSSTSASCLIANSKFSGLGVACEIKDWCSQIKPVSYKLSHTRCQNDRHRECLEIGIQLDIDGFFWVVPIQMSVEEFSRRWANPLPGIDSIPVSAIGWKSAIDNLNAIKREEEDKQLARQKAAEDAQLARQRAAIDETLMIPPWPRAAKV